MEAVGGGHCCGSSRGDPLVWWAVLDAGVSMYEMEKQKLDKTKDLLALMIQRLTEPVKNAPTGASALSAPVGREGDS